MCQLLYYVQAYLNFNLQGSQDVLQFRVLLDLVTNFKDTIYFLNPVKMIPSWGDSILIDLDSMHIQIMTEIAID